MVQMEGPMVEPVSHSAGKARIQRASSDSASPIAKIGASGAAPLSLNAGTSVGSMSGAAETVSISTAAKAMPSELKAGPPVDIETVSRIKEAIAQNRYPIDLHAITESLFQSFLEISR